MIHYILLPAKERQALQREYRIRLAIVTLLFLSTSVAIGILCLLPSYFHTVNDEQDALARKATLMQSRKESGGEEVQKQLMRTQVIAEKSMLATNSQPLSYMETLQKILVLRTNNLTLNSLDLSLTNATSTVASVTLLGKAVTRESLLDFKKQLESDPVFTEVTLPLSDLAKSRNVTFSMTLKIKKH